MNIDLLTQTFHPTVFAGKVYGVTGGGHGIGEAIVRGICALGGSVVVIDLDGPNLRRVCDSLGSSAIGIEGDVTNPTITDRAIEQAQTRWHRLDGWVNNAMMNPNDMPDGQSEPKFIRTFEINLLAAWRIAQRIVPIIESHGQGGAIVNVSTIMADLTSRGNAAYTSTKAGLEGLTRSLAVDLAPKRIRVNTISPGMVLTYSGANELAGRPRDQWPEHERFFAESVELMAKYQQPWPEPGLPVHLAAGVLFLLSPAAFFISGADLAIDGAGSVTYPLLHDTEKLQAGQKIVELKQRQRELKKREGQS